MSVTNCETELVADGVTAELLDDVCEDVAAPELLEVWLPDCACEDVGL